MEKIKKDDHDVWCGFGCKTNFHYKCMAEANARDPRCPLCRERFGAAVVMVGVQVPTRGNADACKD